MRPGHTSAARRSRRETSSSRRPPKPSRREPSLCCSVAQLTAAAHSRAAHCPAAHRRRMPPACPRPAPRPRPRPAPASTPPPSPTRARTAAQLPLGDPAAEWQGGGGRLASDRLGVGAAALPRVDLLAGAEAGEVARLAGRPTYATSGPAARGLSDPTARGRGLASQAERKGREPGSNVNYYPRRQRVCVRVISQAGGLFFLVNVVFFLVCVLGVTLLSLLANGTLASSLAIDTVSVVIVVGSVAGVESQQGAWQYGTDFPLDTPHDALAVGQRHARQTTARPSPSVDSAQSSSHPAAQGMQRASTPRPQPIVSSSRGRGRGRRCEYPLVKEARSSQATHSRSPPWAVGVCVGGGVNTPPLRRGDSTLAAICISGA